jgi:hypothetical protein
MSTGGYHAKTVYTEQGSTRLMCSSGAEIQVMNGGLIDLKGKLEAKSGAEIEIESGSTINVESGGVINIQSGAKLYNKNINEYSSAATITNDGVSVITSTADGVYTMATPVLGADKYIVVNSTNTIKVKGSTDDSVRFATTAGGTVLIFGPPSTDISVETNYGFNVHLRGASTKLWYMLGYTSTSVVTVATAT